MPWCRMEVSCFGRTVLLSDRSGLGGDTRPVGDQGQKRPGSADFWDLVHDPFDSRVMLASQAVFGALSESLEIVQWAGSACPRTFHDVQINHGGGDVGMTQEALDGADVGSGFQQVGGE